SKHTNDFLRANHNGCRSIHLTIRFGQHTAGPHRCQMFCHLQHYFSASAPPMTSAISLVICACLARLYCRVKLLIMSPAFSVAAFMATRRAICSLTAASRKHLNNRTLNDTGRISSRMSLALGMNSYSTGLALTTGPVALRVPGSVTEESGNKVSITGTCRAAFRNFM